MRGFVVGESKLEADFRSFVGKIQGTVIIMHQKFSPIPAKRCDVTFHARNLITEK